MNLYHVTKFSPYFSFTVYCFYTKISSFMPVLSKRIVLDCFYLLIFYFEKFSTDVCRLPCAVNVNLNLSNISTITFLYLVRLKIFGWIKLLRRHLHQFRETVLIEISELLRVWIDGKLCIQECRVESEIYNYQRIELSQNKFINGILRGEGDTLELTSL